MMTLEERCKLATDCLPLAEYRTRLEALHAELLALRKDAERYDWLRHRAPFGPTRRPVVWMTVSHGEDLPDTHETWLDDDELDEAVDAAMAEAPAVGAA